MKTQFSAFLLSLFLTFAAGASFAQQQPQQRLVTVVGTGEVFVKPNEAVLNLGVESRSKTLDEARKQTDERVANLIKILRNNGIEQKDIQTTYMSLYPGYGRDQAEPQIEYYTAHKGMTVIVRDLSKIESLQIALSKSGLNRMDGIQFRSSEMVKHRAQARKLAVAAAREKANALTTDLGVKTGQVFSITEISSEGPRPYYNAKMEMSQADMGGSTIEPGQISVQAGVEVSFVIVD